MKAQVARIMNEPVAPAVLAPVPETVPQPAASVVGISKRFGKTSVLENISFDVAEGEALVLLGASGSGKTTILRIIAGLEQPTSGRILSNQQDITTLPAQRRNMGMVFQNYTLFPHLDVFENIAFGLRTRGVKSETIEPRVTRALASVRMADYARRQVQQQVDQSRRLIAAEQIAQQLVLLRPDAREARNRRKQRIEQSRAHQSLSSHTNRTQRGVGLPGQARQ